MKHSPTGPSERRPRVGDKVYLGLTPWTVANVQVKKRLASLSRVPQGMRRGIRAGVTWDELKWNDEAGTWSAKWKQGEKEDE